MLKELDICSIDPQSYLLLKEGSKPVIRVGIERSGLEEAKKSARRMGLKLMIKEFKQLYGGKLTEPLINVYYSLNKELCRKAYQAEKEGNRKKFGQLLGYPECCVSNFIESLIKELDLTLVSMQNVKTRTSFYCNNLFVFDSKLRSFDIPIYRNHLDIFDNPTVRNLFLIRHTPCSFDCKKSIRIGKITLKLLKNNFPDLAKEISNALKNPVLYWNYFEWIMLKGHTEDNILKYKEILDYESLVKKEIKDMVGEGNHIKISSDKMVIFNDTEKTWEIPRKNGIPLCIDFQ